MEDMMKGMMGGKGMPGMPASADMGSMMEMAQKMMGGGMGNMLKGPPGMPKGGKMGRR